MRGKPRVEAGVKFVQGNFFAGETFLDLADAQSKMAAWLAAANDAGARHHPAGARGGVRRAGSAVPAARPRRSGTRCRTGREVKVHVDYHIQVARALYSVPWRHAGSTGDGPR